MSQNQENLFTRKMSEVMSKLSNPRFLLNEMNSPFPEISFGAENIRLKSRKLDYENCKRVEFLTSMVQPYPDVTEDKPHAEIEPLVCQSLNQTKMNSPETKLVPATPFNLTEESCARWDLLEENTGDASGILKTKFNDLSASLTQDQLM